MKRFTKQAAAAVCGLTAPGVAVQQYAAAVLAVALAAGSVRSHRARHEQGRWFVEVLFHGAALAVHTEQRSTAAAAVGLFRQATSAYAPAVAVVYEPGQPLAAGRGRGWRRWCTLTK